jgi:nicotinamide-nucleotide amidase
LASGVSRPRAAIVASGSELVRGDRNDRNGPFLAASLVSLGITPASITIVGDDPDDLEAAFAEGLGFDLLCVSGGLGPTHDDRTVELIAQAAGVGLHLDDELVERISELSRRVATRLGRPYADFEAGVLKQATIPDGAIVVGLAGTAPALVLETRGGAVAAVLPGPPRELQALWPDVLATEPVWRVLARAQPPERRVLRFYGASESHVARALAEAGGDGDGVEVTICARDFEIHVDLLAVPGAEGRAAELEEALAGGLERYLFSRTEDPTPGLVLDLLRARGLTLGAAESCTGGLVGSRLTSVPGSSDVFLGSVVAYAHEAKTALLDVPEALIEQHGSVSPEVAAAMADGARSRLGADVAVAVTGVAGPGGGTPEKPVGLVYLHAVGPSGGLSAHFDLPGDRETIRGRAAAAALHLVRRIVTEPAQSSGG